MKLLLITTLIFVVSACASNSDWERISDREEMQWKSMNINENDARDYMESGLNSMDVERWMALGFIEKNDILRWSKSQFNAAEASQWRNRGFKAEEAREWAEENFSAQEAGEWVQKSFTLQEALKERSKGLEPSNN